MKVNVENLQIVADRLIEVNKDLNLKFGMETFGDTYKTVLPKPSCGSFGCVVGHLPLFEEFKDIILNLPTVIGGGLSDDEYLYGIFYRDVCEKVLGISEDSYLWTYLFDCNWAEIDNTLEGAVFRIQHAITVLEKNPIVDEDYWEMKCDVAELFEDD